MKLRRWRLLSKEGLNRSMSSAKTPIKQEKRGFKKAQTLTEEEDRKGHGRDETLEARKKAWCLALHLGASSLEGGGVGLGQCTQGQGSTGHLGNAVCFPTPSSSQSIGSWAVLLQGRESDQPRERPKRYCYLEHPQTNGLARLPHSD